VSFDDVCYSIILTIVLTRSTCSPFKMDSGNVFELFSQAVNEGDIVQLDKILNYFKTYNGNLKAERSNSPYFKNKSIPMDFITKPINEQYGTCLEVMAFHLYRQKGMIISAHSMRTR
jgi:hypothetical protein